MRSSQGLNNARQRLHPPPVHRHLLMSRGLRSRAISSSVITTPKPQEQCSWLRNARASKMRSSAPELGILFLVSTPWPLSTNEWSCSVPPGSPILVEPSLRSIRSSSSGKLLYRQWMSSCRCPTAIARTACLTPRRCLAAWLDGSDQTREPTDVFLQIGLVSLLVHHAIALDCTPPP